MSDVENEAARPSVEEKRKQAIALVRELLERLEREDLRELSVTKGDLRVRVRKDDVRAPRAANPTEASSHAEPAPRAEEEPAATPTGAVEVKAPLTGVFYRTPSPQVPPYVQVGSVISVGQVIGLIEAMKLFNEIRSTAAGRVRRILVDDGQLVRAHQPLLEVEAL